jgi:hypothetical protein
VPSSLDLRRLPARDSSEASIRSTATAAFISRSSRKRS